MLQPLLSKWPKNIKHTKPKKMDTRKTSVKRRLAWKTSHIKKELYEELLWGKIESMSHTYRPYLWDVLFHADKAERSVAQWGRIAGTWPPTCCHFGFPWPRDWERPDVRRWESGCSSRQGSLAGSEEKCVWSAGAPPWLQTVNANSMTTLHFFLPCQNILG